MTVHRANSAPAHRYGLYRYDSEPAGQPEQSASSGNNSADADAARELLATHVPDPETNLCVVCLVPGPCRPANVAANRLKELGQPLVPVTGRPRRKRNGWRSWLTPYRRALPRTAPLLTHVWRLKFGVPANQQPTRFSWLDTEVANRNQRPAWAAAW